MLSFHLTVSLILLYLLWYTLNIATNWKNKKPKQKGKGCNLKYSLVLTMDARNSTSSLFTSFTVLFPKEKKTWQNSDHSPYKISMVLKLARSYLLKSMLCKILFASLSYIFLSNHKNPKWLTCSGPVIIKHFLRLSFIIQILGCNHL